MQSKIQQVNISSESWGTLIDRVNIIAAQVSNNTVVTIANTAGDSVTGNGFVSGIFGGTTLVADTIRGGNVATVGELSVNSAIVFQNTVSYGNGSVSESFSIDTSGTSEQTIDSWAAATYRSAKYLLQVKNGVANAHQVTELLVIHDGTAALSTEYATLLTNGSVGVFTVDVNAGNVRLRFTPVPSSATVKVSKNLLKV